MKVNLITLGCAKNQVDSELTLGLLKKMGYEITPFKDSADLIIINTCGFIESAKVESINKTLDVITNKNSNQKVVVIGCLSTRYKKELEKEIPEVDKYVTINEYKDFEKIIGSLFKNNSNNLCFDFNNRVLSTPSYSAYVRIGDGCDNRCSYCAIPLIRGGFNSRYIKDIILEIKNLGDKGIKEIILIAQDTTRFGKETNERIEDLLIEIEKINSIELVRLLYLYPDEISDELIDIIANSKKIAHYFDIPIQHASNKILKLMNRRGTKEDIISIYNKIKLKMSDAILRTTIMVGFPYEDDNDFNELVDFIQKYPFDRLGAFMYSKEEDTKAFDMPQIDEEVKKQRYNKIMTIQNEIAKQKNAEKLGTFFDCYIDGYDFSKGLYKARSYQFSLDGDDGFIYIKSKTLLKVGTKIKVKIESYDEYDLYGSIA